MPIKLSEIEICYLCGNSLEAPISKDHVPLFQIYAKEIRKTENLNLLKLPVHDKCNKSFQHDEDYFVHTLLPFGKVSKTGESLLKEKFKIFHEQGEQVKLKNKVLKEFVHKSGGIHLPTGLVAKKVDPDRFYRVATKILRGLFFYNEGVLITEDKPIKLDIISPDQQLPEAVVGGLGDKPILGDFKPCFSYRYGQFPEVHNMWFWAFWIWEGVTLTFAFHDLSCECDECKPLDS